MRQRISVAVDKGLICMSLGFQQGLIDVIRGPEENLMHECEGELAVRLSEARVLGNGLAEEISSEAAPTPLPGRVSLVSIASVWR